MTDFIRLKIDNCTYRRIADKAEFFTSVRERIEDAVIGQRGDWDWFAKVQDFFNEIRFVWKTLEERKTEGAVRLNHDSPERYIAEVQPDHIGGMGLVEVLTLLRKATAAELYIEEYNCSCPGNQPRKPDPDRDRRFIGAFCRGLILPALQRLNDLLEISPADIGAVLSLKPIFDSLSVEEFRRWNGWEPVDLPEGGQALHVPYPNYHPVVREWTIAVFCTPFYIDPYRGNPIGMAGTPTKFIGIGSPGRPTVAEFFADADLDDVRQFMTLIIRVERFCDGNIAGEFESGAIQASFHRLDRIARA